MRKIFAVLIGLSAVFFGQRAWTQTTQLVEAAKKEGGKVVLYTSMETFTADALKKAEEFVELEEGALNKLRGALGTFVTAVAVTQGFAKLFDVAFEFTQLGHGNSPPARISMHNTMNLLTQ